LEGKSVFLAFQYGVIVRPFVRNNHYSVCKRNRIGGFARDDGLPQHLAAVSFFCEL